MKLGCCASLVPNTRGACRGDVDRLEGVQIKTLVSHVTGARKTRNLALVEKTRDAAYHCEMFLCIKTTKMMLCAYRLSLCIPWRR